MFITLFITLQDHDFHNYFIIDFGNKFKCAKHLDHKTINIRNLIRVLNSSCL